MKNNKIYKSSFYKKFERGSFNSAQEIIPILFTFIRPKSVVDVGCGIGTWLAIIKEHNIEDILGIDGNYINSKLLKIPEKKFITHNLNKPLYINRKFNLVISLEVVEHLQKESAKTFIDSLIKLGPIILFSAAIPFQTGENHINEQWPEYWSDLFLKKGYFPIDCIRDKVWNNKKVEWWYAQNILLFVKKDFIENNLKLKEEFLKTNKLKLSKIHPSNYRSRIAAFFRIIKKPD